MERDAPSLAEELRDIAGRAKALLLAAREMGLDPPSLSPSAVRYLEKGPQGGESLEALEVSVSHCGRCMPCRGRFRAVFGEGPPQARLAFVGGTPDEEEDREGRPFVGEPGKLLTRIIHAMGLERDEAYFCSAVKCRPSGDGSAGPDQISACLPFLRKQLLLIRPEVICALGPEAGQALFGEGFKTALERGKWKRFMGIPAMPTHHPAYLLQNPSAKKEAWIDIQKVMARLGLEVRAHD